MEININIKKKYVWILFFAVVVVGFAFAQSGSKPDPGHSLSEIAGLDQDNNGVVDNADKLASLTPAQLQNMTWDQIDYVEEDVNKAIFPNNPVGRQSIAEEARFCAGGNYNPDYGCCKVQMDALCQARGYTMSIGAAGGTCGQGWCRGKSPCLVGTYCIKITNP